jgi:phenylalanyl-tRNA synthetase beta chain
VYQYKDLNRAETVEHRCLALAQTGSPEPDTWYRNSRSVDFFDLKGAIQLMIKEMGAEGIEFRPGKCAYLDHRESAVLMQGEKVLGYAGKLASSLQKIFDIKQDIFLGEMDFSQFISGNFIKYYCKELPKYPKIERDVSIVVDDQIDYASVKGAIASLNIRELISVNIFDIYQGEELGAGKKALAIRVIYQDLEKTLSTGYVDQLHKTVLASLESAVGARLRS